MKVSIVIPNYNGQKFIKSCLESLLSQSFSLNYEIIFIDNNSSDNSIEFINSNYKNIKVKKLDKNYGFSRAVNEGIKISMGEYVILLNNDTELESNWLEELVGCIEKDEKLFSCCSKMIQYTNRDKIDDAGDRYTIFGWTEKRGDSKGIAEYVKDEEVFSSCAGAAIYRKEIFEEIGYFDENFFAYMEDVDIGYRAKIHGYKNMYCSSAIVYHIGSATSGSKYNSFKVKLAARNNIYVIYKNMPLIQIIINFPFLIIGLLVKSMLFYKKGFSNDYINGLKEGLFTLDKIKKTKYKNKNLLNYVKIEFEIIRNTFKFLINKLRM